MYRHAHPDVLGPAPSLAPAEYVPTAEDLQTQARETFLHSWKSLAVCARQFERLSVCHGRGSHA